MSEPLAICNGCGNESSAWDKLCDYCSQEVTCQSCHEKYKRGQGLQEVDICPRCLEDSFAAPPANDYKYDPEDVNFSTNPYEDYGFDYQWETYNGK